LTESPLWVQFGGVNGRAGQLLVLGLGLAVIGCGRGAVGASDGGPGAGAGTAGASGRGGAAAAGGAGAGAGGSGGRSTGMTDGGLCAAFTGYTPTTTSPLSFAADIYPILTDVGSVPPTTPGCASASICHGSTPIALDPKGVKKLSFTDPPATVLAALLATDSVNAPTMKLVVAGSVAQSFFAYKISGADGLSCVAAACVSGASVGTAHPCGDPMPTATTGVLSAAERVKILDWIALGAAN
jgi:hypothetical protein